MGVSTEISIGLAHEVINALVRRGFAKEQLTQIAENTWGITDSLAWEFVRLIEQCGLSELGIALPIELLDLDRRIYSALKRQGINLVSDLCKASETDLRNIRFLGFKGIEEVKDKLAKRGLSLRVD